MASVVEYIKKAVIGGSEVEARKLTERAVDEGCEANEIINNGLVAGINAIGKMWKQGEAFIPEVVRAAEVMRASMTVIGEELIAKSSTMTLGKVVIGTVKGDVHDVGKSLVRMMMEAVGFTVHDLGIDVAPEKFVEAAKTQEAEMVCMSALLTTTMQQMEHTIRALKEAGLRVKTMVGGSPVTQEYADNIGADGYAPDAVLAVDKAKELLKVG